MMQLFGQMGIRYKYSETEGGHTYLVWRRNLRDFAPLLFR